MENATQELLREKINVQAEIDVSSVVISIKFHTLSDHGIQTIAGRWLDGQGTRFSWKKLGNSSRGHVNIISYIRLFDEQRKLHYESFRCVPGITHTTVQQNKSVRRCRKHITIRTDVSLCVAAYLLPSRLFSSSMPLWSLVASAAASGSSSVSHVRPSSNMILGREKIAVSEKRKQLKELLDIATTPNPLLKELEGRSWSSESTSTGLELYSVFEARSALSKIGATTMRTSPLVSLRQIPLPSHWPRHLNTYEHVCSITRTPHVIKWIVCSQNYDDSKLLKRENELCRKIWVQTIYQRRNCQLRLWEHVPIVTFGVINIHWIRRLEGILLL